MTNNCEVIGHGALLLRQWLTEADTHQIIGTIRSDVLPISPFRFMERRRGGNGNKGKDSGGSSREAVKGMSTSHTSAPLSVAMTNCGTFGWVTDAESGYGYTKTDPLRNANNTYGEGSDSHGWPPMPSLLLGHATAVADAAGYPHYTPDVCLINQYLTGARLALHTDNDEEDLQEAPIVSMSLGLPCTFLWGGGSDGLTSSRGDKPREIRLNSGDVVVWGGPSRLAYHGVAPLAACSKGSAAYKLLDGHRWNLTFRMAKGLYRR